MGARYGRPFKLFTVLLDPENPTTGKRRQLQDRTAALEKAREIARETHKSVDEVFWESDVYYAREYVRGRQGGRRVCTGQSIKELAVQWCKERERQGLGSFQVGRVLFSEAVEEWLTELDTGRLRPKSLRELPARLHDVTARGDYAGGHGKAPRSLPPTALTP